MGPDCVQCEQTKNRSQVARARAARFLVRSPKPAQTRPREPGPGAGSTLEQPKVDLFLGFGGPPDPSGPGLGSPKIEPESDGMGR